MKKKKKKERKEDLVCKLFQVFKQGEVWGWGQGRGCGRGSVLQTHIWLITKIISLQNFK